MYASLAKAVIDRNANSAFRSLFFFPTEEYLTLRLSSSPPRGLFCTIFSCYHFVFLMTFGAVSGMVQSFGS